jgi:hypothetical protein
MSVEIEDIPGLDQASAMLDQLIAADAAAATSAATPDAESVQSADPADDGTHAAQTEEIESTLDPATKPSSDTQAAKPEETEAKPGEKPDDKPKSRYEKARERQERTWAEVNAEKDAIRKEREAFAAEREKFEREREEIKAQREKAEGEFTPDQYESAAKRFEDEGKFDLADLARKKAQDLRSNPPAAQAVAVRQHQEAQKREWALKAGQEFPELAKDRSPLQQRVAQLFQSDPELKAHPKGIYLAARLASLEAEAAQGKTQAVRVSELEKELGLAKARVQELEGLTAPGGPGSAPSLGGAKSFEQMSDAEQFAELSRHAQEVGTLTT